MKSSLYIKNAWEKAKVGDLCWSKTVFSQCSQRFEIIDKKALHFLLKNEKTEALIEISVSDFLDQYELE